MTQQKKPHLRKCVGCGQMRDKAELIRICRTESGSILQDDTGKRNGRGAYLCRNGSCLQKALKNRSLERSLKCRIDPAVIDVLQQTLS